MSIFATQFPWIQIHSIVVKYKLYCNSSKEMFYNYSHYVQVNNIDEDFLGQTIFLEIERVKRAIKK